MAGIVVVGRGVAVKVATGRTDGGVAVVVTVAVSSTSVGELQAASNSKNELKKSQGNLKLLTGFTGGLRSVLGSTAPCQGLANHRPKLSECHNPLPGLHQV